MKLGSLGGVCQIDKSMIRNKPKNHRRRATDHEIWILGIADCSYIPAPVYLERVESRSEDVLLLIIQNFVRDSTVILTEQWRAYEKISEDLPR